MFVVKLVVEAQSRLETRVARRHTNSRDGLLLESTDLI